MVAATVDPFVSDFARIELASVTGRLVRMRLLTREQAAAIFANFDTCVATLPDRPSLCTTDVAEADTLLRRLDLDLRAPDMLHVVIARRLGATLATFDRRMADAARTLGLAVTGA